ncbi:ribonuclease YeeF family protein [uncultured Rossellomorea sp.]|uniref:ribonuclease YeeF family protein n=1 Tax=uncultured Rossellomorea sp. TaxID=2837549 RepID=UPI0026251765|nr:LXG domain-containing protein [uncultured Rossellomorea sp.]
MKTLDVMSLESGLEQVLRKVNQQKEQMIEIESAINDFISQDASFKGKAGQSIRAFYQDSHQSFLEFYQQMVTTYESTLEAIKNELQGLEPAQNGYIQENFLQHDMENGLNRGRDMVMDLTTESNETIQSVQDIVSLPRIQDDFFLQQVHIARQQKDQTVEKLHQFDQSQSAKLEPIQQDVHKMNQYIHQIQGLFSNGKISIDTYQPNSCYNPQYMSESGSTNPYFELTNNPRFVENGVEAADTVNGLQPEWDPTPTLGVNFDQWREQPINAATNLGIATAAGYGAAKSVNLARKGFGVTKNSYTTAQGKDRVRLKVDKPELYKINKRNYSGTNATNYTKLYKLVDPMTSVKESFKWAGNRIGYIGVGTTVVGDIVHGVQHKQSGSEIAGNVTGDVAIAGASIAASAMAGAKFGAMAGVAFGGPVGVAVGAVVGAGIGILVTTALSDVKFMDVDGDGESDSIGDAIKKGTTSIIDKVGSWF